MTGYKLTAAKRGPEPKHSDEVAYQIPALLEQGYRKTDIAHKLGVSHTTVNNMLKRIGKL